MEQEFYGAAFKANKQANTEVKAKSSFGTPPGEEKKTIDLNEHLIRNKSANFFLKMKGDAMTGCGIFDNDILVVDRSLKLNNGKIIVAILNGELLVRRFHKNFSSAFLIPENPRLKSINLAEFTDFSLWGVVTFVIHPV